MSNQVDHDEIRFALFALGLFPGSLGVLYPARAMKSMGFYLGKTVGRFPERKPGGGGQWFCNRYRKPVLLKQRPRDEQARDFDRVSNIYDGLVGISSVPVVEEGIRLVSLLSVNNSRILDLSCGPGTEIPALATLVPQGEVVGVDLSAGMIIEAHQNSRSAGVSNSAFFQADVLQLPKVFEGKFDLVFCCDSFHHYRDPLAALTEIRRVLSPEGNAIIIDPKLSQWSLVTESISKWGDPGFVGFYSSEELHRLFMTAGYVECYWNEMLPLFGVSIGTK